MPQTPAPKYVPGQKVWLAGILLKSLFCKPTPRYIGPYEIEVIISPMPVKFKLPAYMCIHPNFHVFQVKPVHSSSLSPLTH